MSSDLTAVSSDRRKRLHHGDPQVAAVRQVLFAAAHVEGASVGNDFRHITATAVWGGDEAFKEIVRGVGRKLSQELRQYMSEDNLYPEVSAAIWGGPPPREAPVTPVSSRLRRASSDGGSLPSEARRRCVGSGDSGIASPPSDESGVVIELTRVSPPLCSPKPKHVDVGAEAALDCDCDDGGILERLAAANNPPVELQVVSTPVSEASREVSGKGGKRTSWTWAAARTESTPQQRMPRQKGGTWTTPKRRRSREPLLKCDFCDEHRSRRARDLRRHRLARHRFGCTTCVELFDGADAAFAHWRCVHVPELLFDESFGRPCAPLLVGCYRLPLYDALALERRPLLAPTPPPLECGRRWASVESFLGASRAAAVRLPPYREHADVWRLLLHTSPFDLADSALEAMCADLGEPAGSPLGSCSMSGSLKDWLVERAVEPRVSDGESDCDWHWDNVDEFDLFFPDDKARLPDDLLTCAPTVGFGDGASKATQMEAFLEYLAVYDEHCDAAPAEAAAATAPGCGSAALRAIGEAYGVSDADSENVDHFDAYFGDAADLPPPANDRPRCIGHLLQL